MPFSWEKVISNKPHVLETARGWYDKWIRGERVQASANDAVDRTEPDPTEVRGVSAYAEPIKIEDVVEVKEATRDVTGRLEALEFAGMAQAETVKNLADQSQTLSERLSRLQGELQGVGERMEEIRADSEGHRVSMEGLDTRMQKLSDDLSRLSSRVTMAIWVAVVGVAGSIVALSVAFMR